MFTYSERDMHRMPAPIKTHLPIKAEIMNSGIMEEDAAGRENEADPNLARLPAPALHGTFAKAYALLTRLASKIGWDDLLKCRSQVFVMEEEYRMQKAKEDTQKSSTSVNEQEQEQHSRDEPTPSSPASAQENDEQKEQTTETSAADEPKNEEADNKNEEAKEDEQSENGEPSEATKEATETSDELADQMDTVDLNADESGEQQTTEEENQQQPKVEVHHTPLERPTQAAEDPSKVSFESSKQNPCISANLCLIFRLKPHLLPMMRPSTHLIPVMASTFHLVTSVFVSVG